MHATDPAPESDAMNPRPQPADARPTIRSTDLLQGHREVFIEHGDEVYRLLVTRNGKLILQK